MLHAIKVIEEQQAGKQKTVVVMNFKKGKPVTVSPALPQRAFQQHGCVHPYGVRCFSIEQDNKKKKEV